MLRISATLFSLFACVVAGTAAAEGPGGRSPDWVSLGEGDWLDRSSVRKDGEFTLYTYTWVPVGERPEPDEVGAPKAFKCSTQTFYNADGQRRSAWETGYSKAKIGLHVKLLCSQG